MIGPAWTSRCFFIVHFPVLIVHWRPMKLTILYFAHLAERTGTREETRDVPSGATAAALRELLAKAHPKLGDALKSCRVAVQEEFVADSTLLAEGNTVAFIPPVSGG